MSYQDVRDPWMDACWLPSPPLGTIHIFVSLWTEFHGQEEINIQFLFLFYWSINFANLQSGAT